MRTADIDQALLLTISKERLTKYFSETADNLSSALALYEANAKLSEAFYFPLHCCEICFRNALHDQLSKKYGDRWFEDSSVPLTAESENEIHEVLEDLNKREADAPPAGSVVAELKFSFWVGLLGPKYDHTLWRAALYKAFLAKGGKPRKEVHGRFNAIRRFRNRVFHHEPIFKNLPADKHTEIIESISWICPKTSAWAEHHSRVDGLLF